MRVCVGPLQGRFTFKSMRLCDSFSVMVLHNNTSLTEKRQRVAQNDMKTREHVGIVEVLYEVPNLEPFMFC